MKIIKETNMSIISTNLSESILKSFSSYTIFNNSLDIKKIKELDKIVLFNSLHLLNKSNREKLIKYLKESNKDFIIITNNIEDVIYTDYLVVIDESESILIEGNTLKVLEENKLLKRLGFNIPFYFEMSNLLIDYGLINSIYSDKESLAGALWN
jgi:hypothetical protein